MKKIFTYIGISTLVCISFIVTEKTALVVKESDPLMQEIKEKATEYQIEPIDAIIKENTIIPGLNGKILDIEKTYNEMKKINQFNENYIIYKQIKPKISQKEQYDKYIISGNPKKNMVSIIFIINKEDIINDILEILKKETIKATFFVDGYWFENNNELALELIKKGHTIGNLSYNLNYEDTGYIWIDNILKTIGKQKNNYCYYTEKENNLKACTLKKNYTIKPSILVKENPLIEIKQKITSGSIIELKINKKTIEELPHIINYIKQKGYQIDTIENHLNEKIN